MPGTKYIFMSDLHIGTNYPTNWYQRSVHEDYLKCILRYVQDNARDIEDMVILGDWFDFWMYPPDTAGILPADIGTIMDANPGVFTRQADGSGDFITCLDNIRGHFYYLRGNHDMNYNGNADLAIINKRFSGTKQVEPGWEVAPGCFMYPSAEIYSSHGHSPYSPLCRQDYHDARYWQIPIGYFISRTVAKFSSEHFTQSAPNAAWLPRSGNPSFPFNVEEILSWLSAKSVAELVIRAFVDMTTKSRDYDRYMYAMPDGYAISATQVAGLFNIPQGWNTETIKWLIDNDLNDRLHFDITDDAYRFANRKVMVMGHTHVPLLSYSRNDRKYLYANTGYLCASIPDMREGRHPTFVEVEKDASRFTVTLQHVLKDDSGISRVIHDPSKDVLSI